MNRRERVIAVGAALVTLVMTALVLTYGHGRDQSIYAVVARGILDGQMPYRDVWDFKPPGVFFVYAIARGLFGAHDYSIRIVEAAGMLAMGAGLVHLGRRFFGSPVAGWLACALAATLHAQLDFWHTAQPESFGGMLTIAALACAPDPEHKSPRRWYGAGILFGLAGLMKPPLALGGLVVGLARLTPTRTSRWASWLQPLGFGLLGLMSPLVLTALWLAWGGAARDAAHTLFVFTPHYTRLGWEGSSVLGMLYAGVTEWLDTYSSLSPVGLALLLGFGPLPRERRFAVEVVGVIAIHILGVVAQAKFFPYHYGATWPLTAMLAGLGFAKLWERMDARIGALSVGALALSLGIVSLMRSSCKDTEDSFRRRAEIRATAIATFQFPTHLRDALASVADVEASSNRATADYLAATTPPEAPIFVWGFEPAIYDLSNRHPASRFIYNVPQRATWSKQYMRGTLMADLMRTPAEAIVIERNDVFPMVTGDGLGSSDAMRDFEAFSSLLAEQYAQVATFGDLTVFRRLPPSN